MRIEVLFFIILLWGTAAAGASLPVLGESLEYTLKFRGLITGYVELNIAKVTLQVEGKMGQVADTPAFITNMHLTTAPFSKAELLYPVRLSYRSWLDARELRPLIAVKSLKAREDREELFWFDRDSGHAYHYQSGETSVAAPKTPPLSLQGITALSSEQWSALIQTQALEMGDADASDYMGLLYQLRRMPLENETPIDFSTYNGKEIQWFRIDVSRERLVRAGWDRAAFRLVLREIDPQSGELGDEVRLWVSDDDERLLLRFYAKRTFGAMEGILETGRPKAAETDKQLSEATRSSIKRYLDF